MRMILTVLLLAGAVRAEDSTYKLRVIEQHVMGHAGTDLEVATVGTCFAISKHVLATASHNISDKHLSMRVEIEGKWVAAKLVSIQRVDLMTDIALISVEQELKPLTCKVEPLRACGFPRNGILKNVVGNESYAILKCDGADIGMSGGPVFDHQGNVVGVVTAVSKERDLVYYCGIVHVLDALLLHQQRQVKRKAGHEQRN